MIYTNLIQKNNDKSKYLTLSLRLLIFFIIPLMFGLLSLFLGRDINWDLKNYHYYNAYAFVEHRMDYDIAPAQFQTFYNPLLDIPFYIMTKYLPSWAIGFIMGFVHGVNLSLIFLIFWKTYNYENRLIKFAVGICTVIVSSIAPGFLSELGNTMNDNVTSLFVLIVLLILMHASENFEKCRRLLGFLQIGIAGIIMGLGVGMKPTIVTLALGSAFALVILLGKWQNKLAGFLIYGLTGIVGGLISGGFWWWELWSRYGNPFLPYLNNIFNSPYIASVPFIDNYFFPRQLWEYFMWPLLFSLDSYRVNPLQFFDVRFALLYLICFIWLFVSLIKIFRSIDLKHVGASANLFDVKQGTFLLIFFIFSFILWMIQSSNYRYIIALELLVPLCFLYVVDRIVRSEKLQIIFVIGAVLATFILFKPFNWGRLDWSDSYFSVDTSRLKTSENAVVIMLGSSPTSYVIPQFPPNYRFLRPEGNLYFGKNGNSRDSLFLVNIRNLLKRHNGNIYILFDKNEKNILLEQSLANLKLDVKIADCSLLVINTPDELEFCRLSGAK